VAKTIVDILQKNIMKVLHLAKLIEATHGQKFIFFKLAQMSKTSYCHHDNQWRN